jgi:NitT/TauT family transport system substrate-binding protein
MARIQMMSIRHSAFYTPYLMTIAGGFLQAEGLDPEYRPATADDPVDKAFAKGRCQVSQSAVATGFLPLERNQPVEVRHFARINDRDGFFLVSRQPMPRFRWTELRGRSVLVDHFFQPLAMLRFGMERQGVAFDEINAIDAGDVSAIDRAFREGQGDLVHLQGPAAQQLVRDGIGQVVAAVGDAVGPVAFSSLCARPDWLATGAAEAFMRAYRRSLALVDEATADELAARLRDAGFFRDIDPSVLVDTIRTYQDLGCWNLDPRISRVSYERLLDVFEHSGLLSTRYPMEDLVVEPPG